MERPRYLNTTPTSTPSTCGSVLLPHVLIPNLPIHAHKNSHSPISTYAGSFTGDFPYVLPPTREWIYYRGPYKPWIALRGVTLCLLFTTELSLSTRMFVSSGRWMGKLGKLVALLEDLRWWREIPQEILRESSPKSRGQMVQWNGHTDGKMQHSILFGSVGSSKVCHQFVYVYNNLSVRVSVPLPVGDLVFSSVCPSDCLCLFFRPLTLCIL